MKHAMMIVILGIMLSGCRKLIDTIHKYSSGELPAKSSCRIDSIYPASVYLYSTTAKINYNEKGFPVMVNYNLNDEYQTLVRVDYYYDEKDRLIRETPDYVYAGPKDVMYVYEGNSKLPIRDTILELYSIVIEDLYYDFFGRVNKVVKHTKPRLDEDNSVYPDVTFKYQYDESGNRQEDAANENYPGPIEYTNKPSLYSLHPVWKLIHKDFSRNTTNVAAAYNEHGFPLRLSEDEAQYIQPFLHTAPAPGYQFSYTCLD